MDRLLMMIAAAAIGLAAGTAKADIDAFYSGVYLGMPILDCYSYYHGGNPPIAKSHTNWGRAPAGQQMVDFRTEKQERRVQIIYRKSDGIIVSIGYYNIDGGHFENEDLKQLLEFQRGRVPGRLVSHLYGKYRDEVPKGKIFYIPGDSLGDSPDWTGLNVTPPEPSSSEDDAKWAKAPGGWADEVAERPSNAEASAAMNKLQDAKGKPHVKGGVWYDDVMKTYNWIGPKSGKKMSENTDEFWSEVGPYLK
jgi:hypothetical protein